MATILIVDDDTQVRKFMCRCIEHSGHHAIEAANGNEAIALVLAHHPAVVVTDIIMPEKEGLDTILELRHIAPEIKIIAMSGGGKTSADAYLHIASDLGAQVTLEKPIDKTVLIQAIDDLLGDSCP